MGIWTFGLGYPDSKMFRTLNEAHQYIAEMIRSGDFKNCVHLTVIDASDYDSKPWEPYCQKHSLCRPKNYDQCPRDCLLFEDKEARENTSKGKAAGVQKSMAESIL